MNENPVERDEICKYRSNVLGDNIPREMNTCSALAREMYYSRWMRGREGSDRSGSQTILSSGKDSFDRT